MIILPQRSSLVDVIGQGLSDLATAYGEHQTSLKALKGLGFNDAQARAYASLGPQIQQQAIQAKQQQQQQEAANAAISQILGTGLGAAPQAALQQYQPQQVQAQPQMAAQPMNLAAPQEAAVQQATSIAQNPAFRKLQEQQQQAQALQNQQLMQRAAPAARAATPEQQAILQSQAQQAIKEPSFKDKLQDVRRRKQALNAANLSIQDRTRVHDLLQQEEDSIKKDMREEERNKTEREKASDKKQARIDKETLPYYEKVKREAESADEMNMRLDQYEALLDTGKVSSNTFLAFLDELGNLGGITGAFGRVISTAATNTETQVAKKLAADFMTGAKDVIGSQMPVAEMQMFMQRVPNLMQTVEGQRAVMRNFRAIASIQKERDKVMDKIIEDNNDERPRHLQSKVSNNMKDYKGDMRKSFADSIKLIRKPSFSFNKPRTPLAASTRGVYSPDWIRKNEAV